MSSWYRDFREKIELVETMNLRENIESKTVEGPEDWRIYLISGKDDELSREEKIMADKWLSSLGDYTVTSCHGQSHFSNDFSKFDPNYESGSVIKYVLNKK